MINDNTYMYLKKKHIDYVNNQEISQCQTLMKKNSYLVLESNIYSKKHP